MSITYTILASETLPDDQTRIIRGYNVLGGVILNIQVILHVAWPHNPDIDAVVIDKELFIPNTTVDLLAGLVFTELDAVTLDKGQKRIIREAILTNGTRILELIRTQDYQTAQDSPTKTQIVDEVLTLQGNSTTCIRKEEGGAYNVSGYISPVWAPNYPSALETTIFLGVGDRVEIHGHMLGAQQTWLNTTLSAYFGLCVGEDPTDSVVSGLAYITPATGFSVGVVSLGFNWIWGPALSQGNYRFRPYLAKSQSTDPEWVAQKPTALYVVHHG